MKGGEREGDSPLGSPSLPIPMTQKERDLLYSYIFTNTCRLEEELNTLKNNLRFRHIDVSDAVEYIVALQRFDTFREVTTHIRELLSLDIKE